MKIQKVIVIIIENLKKIKKILLIFVITQKKIISINRIQLEKLKIYLKLVVNYFFIFNFKFLF